MVGMYIMCLAAKRKGKELYMHHLGSSAAQNERLLPSLLIIQLLTLLYK